MVIIMLCGSDNGQPCFSCGDAGCASRVVEQICSGGEIMWSEVALFVEAGPRGQERGAGRWC